MIAVISLPASSGLLADNAVRVLTLLVSFVMTPCLLRMVLADADASILLSSLVWVSLVAAIVCMASTRSLSGSPGVEQIAVTCGFGTVETMNRAFRRRLGTTPLQVRHHFDQTPVATSIDGVALQA